MIDDKYLNNNYNFIIVKSKLKILIIILINKRNKLKILILIKNIIYKYIINKWIIINIYCKEEK